MNNTQIISELTRVKALFQARAIAAALGAPQPTTLPAPARYPEQAA